MSAPAKSEMLKGLAAGLVFMVVGWQMLDASSPLVGLAAWISVAFGFVGVAAIVLQLTGLWKPDFESRVKTSHSLQNLPKPQAENFPQLSASKRIVVHRIVDFLAAKGIFEPDSPKPEHLFEAVADQDCKVTQEVVLTATHEAEYYHSEFDRACCMTNLVFHENNVEQYKETLQQQIADLAALSRDALNVSDLEISLDLSGARGTHPPCIVSMKVNGIPLSLSWLPDAKYLSTYIHVALAKELRAVNTAKRFAWLWSDQGAWISLIANDALDQLNAGLGNDKKGYGGWEWIDESEPVAAGAMFVEG